jgi:hypothetical protein
MGTLNIYLLGVGAPIPPSRRCDGVGRRLSGRRRTDGRVARQGVHGRTRGHDTTAHSAMAQLHHAVQHSTASAAFHTIFCSHPPQPAAPYPAASSESPQSTPSLFSLPMRSQRQDHATFPSLNSKPWCQWGTSLPDWRRVRLQIRTSRCFHLSSTHQDPQPSSRRPFFLPSSASPIAHLIIHPLKHKANHNIESEPAPVKPVAVLNKVGAPAPFQSRLHCDSDRRVPRPSSHPCPFSPTFASRPTPRC